MLADTLFVTLQTDRALTSSLSPYATCWSLWLAGGPTASSLLHPGRPAPRPTSLRQPLAEGPFWMPMAELPCPDPWLHLGPRMLCRACPRPFESSRQSKMRRPTARRAPACRRRAASQPARSATPAQVCSQPPSLRTATWRLLLRLRPHAGLTHLHMHTRLGCPPSLLPAQ